MEIRWLSMFFPVFPTFQAAQMGGFHQAAHLAPRPHRSEGLRASAPCNRLKRLQFFPHYPLVMTNIAIENDHL